MLIKDFLKHLFTVAGRLGGGSTSIMQLDTEDHTNSSDVTLIKTKVLLGINWVLSIICLTSFGVIVWFSVWNPDKNIPEIIQNSFSLTLGYFGSALMTFLENVHN